MSTAPPFVAAAEDTGHCFLSYSHVDVRYARRLNRCIRRAGIPVWFDHDLGAGERFALVIQQRIAACFAFVVLATPALVGSIWAMREVSFAAHLGKPVVPLKLVPYDAPLLLHDLHTFDVTNGQLPGRPFLDRLRLLASGSPLES
jgi:hypothetical protein